ncbi:MAG: glycosyl hydrolase [Balneolales bacterium]|nr:glycosyl hydrolase [Balneolales bacterium]
MSFRPEKLQSFQGKSEEEILVLINSLTDESLKKQLLAQLEEGVFGFCFSLYEEGQRPGDTVTGEQIRRRLEILKPYTSWIRTFSCTEGNELIPPIAHEMGFKVLAGAWIAGDAEKNLIEMDQLIKLANDGFVDIAAVGNEVLYRKELTEEELTENIKYVRSKITNSKIPVSYVDAYYEFAGENSITQNCDVILCNCYPYWEGTNFDNSLSHVRHMFDVVKQAAGDKPIFITETGWPSQGEGIGEAMPSAENALKYFLQIQMWAKAENIGVFYFSSFDESWKKDVEGDVGAFWGIWDINGNLKF